jgi:hypothetical protein
MYDQKDFNGYKQNVDELHIKVIVQINFKFSEPTFPPTVHTYVQYVITVALAPESIRT